MLLSLEAEGPAWEALSFPRLPEESAATLQPPAIRGSSRGPRHLGTVSARRAGSDVVAARQ